MDVTCDRCSTEYEFEEALVSIRGTTVKCTQCGHLFKVYRAESPVPGSLPGTHWTLRRVDGSTRELAALAELTDLIEKGLVSRDDEMSRTGKAWRRLGDIEELETFFTEADRRGPSRERESSLPREVTEPSSPGLPEVCVPPLAPLSTAASNSSPVHGDPDEDALTEQRVLPQRSASAAAPRELSPRRARRSSPRPQPMAASAPARSPSVIPLESASTDPDSERSARLGHRPWPLVLSTATVIGLASFWWLSSPPTAAPRATAAEVTTADPAQRFLERADALFATQRLESFEPALDEYLKALGFHESDPHILASIARVHAVWAQELRFGVEDERAPAEAETARRAEWLSKQADLHAAQALRYAETAAQKNPTNVEAQVALADARRLARDVRGAREELRRARAEERSANAETLRVASLLAIAEANGDLRAGRALAAQAVSVAPDMLRAKLLLGRCALADGDAESAKQIMRELLARDAQLPGALALSQLVARPSEPPTAEPAAKPAEGDAQATAPGSHAENLSHEGYISRGQSALETGQVSLAKRMFEQALFIRPSSAPAHTGLGYVALEKGRPQLAIEHFQAAARGGSDDAYIGLGEAYRRLGRNREALRAYQSYLSRSPSGDQLSIARAQVERLGEELGKTRKPP